MDHKSRNNAKDVELESLSQGDKMAADDKTQGVYIPVYILIVIFAISAWLSMNGIFVELPIFVSQQPEGWTLPSILIVVAQAANIGPIIWSVVMKVCKVRDTIVIYLLLGTTILSSILLGVFWNRTAVVAGSERSVALIALTGVVALVVCSSSVILLPFVARFRSSTYVTAFFLGCWGGAIITGLIGLAQGIGLPPTCVNVTVTGDGGGVNATGNGNETTSGERMMLIPVFSAPNFSVGVFCALLCVVLAVSTAAFTALLRVPSCRRHMISGGDDNAAASADGHQNNPGGEAKAKSAEKNGEAASALVADHNNQDASGKKPAAAAATVITRSQCVILLASVFAIFSMAGGLLPSLMPYSCLPYGSSVYTLAIRLSTVAGPVACFIAMRWSVKSVYKLCGLAAVVVLMSVVLTALAAMSPNPPLKHSVIGKIMVISVCILLAATFAYVGIVAAMALRESFGARGLFWFGALTQAGGFVGSIIGFILVNVLQLFRSEPIC